MSRSDSSTEPNFDNEVFQETIVLPTRGRGAPSRGDSAVSPSSSYEDDASSYDSDVLVPVTQSHRPSTRPIDEGDTEFGIVISREHIVLPTRGRGPPSRGDSAASPASSYEDDDDSDVLAPVTQSHPPSTRRIDEGDTVMAGEPMVQPSMVSYVPGPEDHYDQPSRQPHQNANPSLTAAELDELLGSIRTMCDPLASLEDQGDAFCMANRHLDTSCSNYTLVDKTYPRGMRTRISELKDQSRTLADQNRDLQQLLHLSDARCREFEARCARLDLSSRFNAMEQESLVKDLINGLDTQNTSNGQGMPRVTRGHPSAS